MENVSLSAYVKQKRKQYNLTPVDLSEKAEVDLRFVCELAQGKQTLQMDKVNQILNLFGAKLTPTPMTRSKLEL